MDRLRTIPHSSHWGYGNYEFKKGNANTEEGRRQAFALVDREGEERITFSNLKKVSNMLKLNLNDDQVQDAIQSIAGKGKQQITW